MQHPRPEAAMETELEEVARKRVQARAGLFVHLTMYLAVNTGLVLIWLITGRGYPWFVWPMLGWGIGIVGHLLALAVGPGSTVERHAIDKELRRLRARA
jgi:hypothetical protein